MVAVRGTWWGLCLSALLLQACGGDDPASPINDMIPAGEGMVACTPEGSSSGWSFVRIGAGAKPALALGPDGVVHMAFINEALNGWVRYAQLAVGDNAPGVSESVDLGYFYGPIDIVLSSSGQPYVLFHDHSREDQVLAIRKGSATWSLEPMSNAGHDGWYNAGALDASGTLHTVSYDPSGFSGRGVIYGAWNGSSWNVEVAAPGSFDYAGGTAIALTGDGGVHLAFFDDAAGQGRIASRSEDAVWEVTTIEDLSGAAETGLFPDLAVGLDGETLHLVYLARNSATQGVIRYAVGRPGDFQVTDLVEVSDFSIGFSGARDIATLDLDSSGRPVIAVQSRSQLLVLRLADGVTETLADFRVAPGVSFGQQTEVAVDDQGRIHVVWWQSGEDPGTVCHAVNG